MNFKSTFFIFSLSFFSFFTSQAQSDGLTAAKGTNLIAGTFSFTSQGGDLFENFDGDRQSQITFAPSYMKFVMDKLAVGAGVGLTRFSSGDFSNTQFSVSPKVAYFFDAGNPVIPYAGLSVGYINYDGDADGLVFNLGGGIMLTRGALGINFEGGINIQRIKFDGRDDSISGNTIYLAVGLAGFLSKNN